MRSFLKKSALYGALFLVLALPFLPACRKSPEPVARGRAAFMGFGCNRCHQLGGEGGTLGPDLSYVGFRKTREWLDLWLQNPHGWKKNTVMPNFKMAESVRHDLVEFLAAQKGQAFGAKKPWETEELQENLVEKGKVIFTKAGCAGCHGPTGKGGYPNNNVVGGRIPALTLVAEGFSKEELAERIAKGRIPDPEDPAAPAPMIYMPAWEQVLNEAEIHALVEYLYSLRPADAGDSW